MTVSTEEDVDSSKGKDEEEGNRGIILKSIEPFNKCFYKVLEMIIQRVVFGGGGRHTTKIANNLEQQREHNEWPPR